MDVASYEAGKVNKRRFTNSRLNAQYLPGYRFDNKSYELSIGTNIGDLE